MKLQEQVSLQAFNTLGVPARARYFIAVSTPDELRKAIGFSRQEGLPRLVLGGGSNIVLSGDFPGVVIHLQMRGVEIQENTAERVRVRVAAGENWDAFVQYSLSRNWFGLENLSAIPGSVGAAPIQNIGAYGVELSEVLMAVEGIDAGSGEIRRLNREQCQLAYRDSIFKNALRDCFVVSSVELMLSKLANPNLSYPALATELGKTEASPIEVAAAVRRVRGRKLPSPDQVPNAGSFFKNPVVSEADYSRLREAWEDLPAWPVAGGVKLAAGWLLEQAGWKGYQGSDDFNGLGMYHEQALVLINPGHCPGARILELADKVRASVAERFAVELELEPRVY